MDDLERLRVEYTDREIRLFGRDRYSLFQPAYLFMVQQRQRNTLSLLRDIGFSNLKDKTVLELGCGRGGILLEYLTYGANPHTLHGCDLLRERILDAHFVFPQIPFLCADGQYLPYKSRTFDFVLQYTVFSSILSNSIRSNLASEMCRVLKPGGTIIWYDFWCNPTNPQTRGIRPKEIRNLFPNCQYRLRRITLAPPFARQLAQISWTLCVILERIKVLNTHYLAAIQPKLLIKL